MTDQEAMVKVAFLVAAGLAVVAVGYVVIFVVAPLFVLGMVIDFGMRQSYKKKLAEAKASPDLIKGPRLHDFEARFHEGEVLIGWLADLPGAAGMDIYRLTDHGGGTVDDIEMRGLCIHSTRVEFTESKSQLVADPGLEDGTYFYVPVLYGLVIEKEPLSYSFFDFASEVKYRQRKYRVRFRGDAGAVTVEPETVPEIPDLRDAATKMADDILAGFRDRKKLDADLDAAMARIRASDDLTEEEKLEAIELLETRSAPT